MEESDFGVNYERHFAPQQLDVEDVIGGGINNLVDVVFIEPSIV